jgi:outer membrane protein assembly factor BamB
VRWAAGGLAIVAAALAGYAASLPAPTSQASASGGGAGAAAAATVSPWDWPSFGYDAQHTFHGRTTLTAASALTLKEDWFFPTGDAVTATPTVVGDTVYVGAWDDYFYAVNLGTGKLRWRVRLHSQNGITPYPGQQPRDATSDGGLVTSSAWYQPADGTRPPLVIFAGGYTLYALNAATGAVFWEHAYSGTPGALDPDRDSTRIFSSPVVVDGKVIVGVDEDGQHYSGGYIVAASLATGDPEWKFQTDVAEAGSTHVLDDSCGSVWSSGTVLPDLGLVVFGTADCDFLGSAPYADSVLALHVANGTLAWQFHPEANPLPCDQDFGASANAGLSPTGVSVFLGEGAKNGTYYSLDPRTGSLRWATNVVFGGTSGGFIGNTAYDGRLVVGATALGDFLPSSHGLRPVCDPADPRDTAKQEPSVHAFVGATGAVAWQANGSASFSATTISGGLMFNGVALAAKAIQVRVAATGAIAALIALPQFCWSGVATVGDALVFGVGTTADDTPSGIEVLTPYGAPPAVPGSS